MLEGAASHYVRREVVVDGPIGIEAEWLDHLGEGQFLVVDLLVGDLGLDQVRQLEVVEEQVEELLPGEHELKGILLASRCRTSASS